MAVSVNSGHLWVLFKVTIKVINVILRRALYFILILINEYGVHE
jgi:hypothetical protein